ncbi:FRG domain-containing protein [Streptococcus mitis]|uniref:FRG domain protein n=1 Tax=Streptococcus mitis TaxID=28037 RepID=A0A428EDL8_STRMT|nr:FRG domain-containing protein [Streptococcus mitis]RSJ08125.1 FRG domain protein [Streptococcus mitis]
MREYSVTYNNLTKKLKEHYKQHKYKGQTTRDVTSFVRSHTINIETFHDLIMEIAELSYKNPDVMLFYRGQNNNYVKSEKTQNATLYPTIYRSNSEKDINFDFDILEKTSTMLMTELEKDNNVDKEEIKELKKIKLLQYSILQHYEVCKTPLLDLTQSIKVACSFAILDNKDKTGYIYVLGMPYVNGRISVDSEDYITNVRLLSISSSSSKRPFFQEGYLVQTEFASNADIEKGELDFNRRIVAIYKFKNTKTFWGSERPIERENLYPEEDTMKDICDRLKERKYDYIGNEENSGNLTGTFLNLWNNLEDEIRYKTQLNEFFKGLKVLERGKDKLYEKNSDRIYKIRVFRNKLVHNTKAISDKDLENKIEELKKLLKDLKIRFEDIS